MESDLSGMMQKFSLAGNELSGTTLDLWDLESGIKDCKDSLIGRVMGEKIFTIPNWEERDKILQGWPWVIDNQVLVLNRWKESIEGDMEAFKVTPMWVQVWNLPVHWLSKEVGRKIGAVFKQVKEIVIPQMGGKEERHLKLLVLVDLSKPLLRGTIVKTEENMTWVAFKYEQCPDFCYNCEFVGHNERTCSKQGDTSGGKVDNQFGHWLRAGVGKVLSEGLNGKRTVVEQLASTQQEELRGEPNRLVGAQAHSKMDKIEQVGAIGIDANPLIEGISEMEEDNSSGIPVVGNVGVRKREQVDSIRSQDRNYNKGKVQEAIRKQSKRLNRKVYAPMKSRRSLSELNRKVSNQLGGSKRKMMKLENDMECDGSEGQNWKKSKSLEMLVVLEADQVEVGSFPNGAPTGK
nr:uncharacterized protein LOC113724191 [Coffea arabica]